MTSATKTATPYAHIWLDERGRGWIDDTNIKVIEVVQHKLMHALTPDEIYEANDRYITRAQIYAALAYYYDNKAKCDAEMLA